MALDERCEKEYSYEGSSAAAFEGLELTDDVSACILWAEAWEHGALDGAYGSGTGEAAGRCAVDDWVKGPLRCYV